MLSRPYPESALKGYILSKGFPPLAHYITDSQSGQEDPEGKGEDHHDKAFMYHSVTPSFDRSLSATVSASTLFYVDALGPALPVPGEKPDFTAELPTYENFVRINSVEWTEYNSA